MRDVRLITPQGASTLGQIVVTRDPIVVEAANNNTLKTAQTINLPATVCGAIEANEDVDFFKFTVAAGTSLTFHAYAHRLADRIHDLQMTADLILSVRDANGGVRGRPTTTTSPPIRCCTTSSPRPASIYLEVRDVRYQGYPYWTYCIEINDRPFVTQVQPMGMQPWHDHQAAAGRLRPAGRRDGRPEPCRQTSRRACGSTSCRWARTPRAAT